MDQTRRYFSAHGPILEFKPQIDKATGEALDIISVKYGTHAKAGRCVDREHGRKLGPANHLGPNVSDEDAEIKVAFDGERRRLRAILRKLKCKQLKRSRAMPARRLPMPPTPWHVSHISTDGSTAPSHLRTQTGASTSPAVRCLLATGHGHGLPAKPATFSVNKRMADNVLAPMGGCAWRPPPTLVKVRPAAASPHSSASHSEMSYFLYVCRPLVVDAADVIE